MEPATEETVRGDFEDASFTYAGITSTFSRRDGRFWVRTDGPDGKLHEYPIAFTFGVTPLQQYLIEFPGGRLQALTIAWDSRPVEEGGQRWFHLYPGEQITADDALHWTRPSLTWNSACAACHSTNLRRNFDLATDRYRTVWSEIDVACEACHGPGSRHVAWAEGEPGAEAYEGDLGLPVALGGGTNADWAFDDGATIARFSGPRRSPALVEACAPCHSRRTELTKNVEHGQPFLDTHRPEVLVGGLYYPDGQILDEVYVYGSFLQSRMFAAGVVCSDCHDPHSLALRADGNALCGRCHRASAYDTPTHHFHRVGTPGAACVECHMPATTYMVIDPRRDHSLRVPRPDLDVFLGTPDACTRCHTDQSPEWAANAVAAWYGPDRRTERHFGQALHAGRQGAPGADRELAALVTDGAQPPIARATAVAELWGYGSRPALSAIEAGAADADPLVRLAAAYAVEPLPPSERIRLALPLLGDPLRAVRLEAARSLASIPADSLTMAEAIAIERGVEELEAAIRVHDDRASAHTNLGLLYQQRGRWAEAEAEYRKAIELDSTYVQAYANLADLYRALRRDAEGEALIERALATAPDEGALYHVLGLVQVRQGRTGEAVASLRRAVELSPDDARFAYVYAIGLSSTGREADAIQVLESTLERHPWDVDVLYTLATLYRDRGETDAALGYATRLAELLPDDAGIAQLLAGLRRGADTP